MDLVNILFVLLAGFDTIRGPIVLGVYPKNLDLAKQRVIAMKSIDLLHDGEMISKKHSIIDFPSIELKGFVKPFRISLSSKKENRNLRTLALLFEERDDAIFYKYHEDIAQNFVQFIDSIVKIPQKRILDYDFTKDLADFYQNVKATIDTLSRIDHPIKNTLEFPSSQVVVKEPTFYFKVVVVGDPEVGKTSTILRYTDNAFRRSYLTTIGANVTIKDVLRNEDLIELILYDLAGQQKYSSVRQQFYQKTDAIFIIFDLTNPKSFENVPRWYEDFRRSLPNFSKIPLILCGNKCDLQDQIVINELMAKTYAKQINVPYFEISALTGKNNQLVFDYIINACVSKMRKPTSQP